MATKKHLDFDPYATVENLCEALDGTGIVLPSLRVDPASPELKLIELGRVRADVAVRLANALRRGGSE